ncbi:MAG: nucleotidyltransferase domain-containing protein [Pseudonocardiaceae bacterium]
MSDGEMFDPMAIVAVFNQYGVDYVVIGGFAAELHQATVMPTRDIDFTPSTTQENLDRLSAALTDLGARIRTAGVPEGLPFSHDGVSLARAAMWNLTSDLGEFDLSFRPSGTDGYDDLVRHALRLRVRGQEMPVASLSDVIRSKEAAGRQKDLSALPDLVRRLEAQRGTSLDDLEVSMTRRAEQRRGGPPPPPL